MVVELGRVEPLPGALGGRERARYERLKVEEKRTQFLAAQTALRTILGQRTGERPGEVVFGYGEHGKPYLRSYPQLGFNMTHSGELALVAIAAQADIGVDLELVARDRPFLRLARRYFARSEHEWLAGLPPGQHREAFYRTWVLKEAYLKAVGTGLTFPPSGFVLDMRSQPARLVSSELGEDHRGPWAMHEPVLPAGYAGAICVRGALVSVTSSTF